MTIENYRKLREKTIKNILATDMAFHFDHLIHMKKQIEENKFEKKED